MNVTAQRLRFRPYTPDDFPHLLALDTDPAVTQMRGGTVIIRQRYEERFTTILEQQTVSHRPGSRVGFGKKSHAHEDFLKRVCSTDHGLWHRWT